MSGRTRTALASVVVLIAATLATLLGTSAAHATDTGGDGSPTVGCSGAYTVASRPIVGARGPVAGKVIGYLELRWSSACYGNWSRVVLLGNMYTSRVTVHQEIRAEGRTAMSDDFNLLTGTGGTSAWTKYLRLQNSASTACVTTSVSSDFGSLDFNTVGASFCV